MLESIRSKKDKPTIDALRSLKSKIVYADKESGEGVSDDMIVKVMQEMRKESLEAVEELEKAIRMKEASKSSAEIEALLATHPLIAQEKSLIHVLGKYLPEQMSKEDLQQLVSSSIAELQVTSIKEMGKLIKHVSAIVGSKASAKDIGETAKMILSKK